MILTFGETLLRLTPSQPHQRLAATSQLQMGFAGAESNTAAALAQLGHTVYHVTAFPDNPIGDAALQALRQGGIQTEFVIRSGDRMGTYFIESGASIRPTRIVYDRAHSSFSAITENSFDWDNILKYKNWLHVSGITPALSESCRKETLHAVKKAKQAGAAVSFDLNYRRTLWKDSRQAAQAFGELMEHTDYVFANEGSVNDVFGIGSFRGQDNPSNARAAMAVLQERFPQKGIAFTLRGHASASLNEWSGLSLVKGQFQEAPVYPIEVVERLGGGDQFAAGFIHGILSGWDPLKTLNFATAASALKHTIPGDMGFISEKEVFPIMEGNIQGRIIR